MRANRMMVTSSSSLFYWIMFVSCICHSIRIRSHSNHDRVVNYVRGERAHPSDIHEIIIAVQQLNLDVVESILYDVSSTSPTREYLTVDEIGHLVTNLIGTETVLRWLQEIGAQVSRQSQFGEYIYARANIQTWEKALGMTMYKFHRVDDTSTIEYKSVDYRSDHNYVIRSTSYSLPDEIDPYIHEIMNLIHLPARISFGPRFQSLFNTEEFMGSVSFSQGYVTPAKLKEMYSIFGYGTQPTTQAVYGSIGQTYLDSDLGLFQSYFDLDTATVNTIIGPKPTNSTCYSNQDDCSEASLDIQYILAIASNVTTSYWYESSDGTFIDFILNISSTTNPSQVYSISYGSYETDVPPTYITTFNTEAMKLGARGVTLVAAAGDDGVTGFNYRSASISLSKCGYYALWPASSPYVTAVGGTMNGQVLTSTEEIACSSANGSSITTGGGFSNSIPAPSFQKETINGYFSSLFNQPNQSLTEPYNRSHRGYPDISIAANNYEIVIDGELFLVSGTSASTPVFAGMVSLVNSQRHKHGLGSLGWLNSKIYSYGSYIANDITSGSNACTGNSSRCCSIGFTASKGWDPVTGFGSVNYTKFYDIFTRNFSIVTEPTNKPTQAPASSPPEDIRIQLNLSQIFISLSTDAKASSFLSNTSAQEKFRNITKSLLDFTHHRYITISNIHTAYDTFMTSSWTLVHINYTIWIDVYETRNMTKSLAQTKMNITTSLTKAIYTDKYNLKLHHSDSTILYFWNTSNISIPVIYLESYALLVDSNNDDDDDVLSTSLTTTSADNYIITFVAIVGVIIFVSTFILSTIFRTFCPAKSTSTSYRSRNNMQLPARLSSMTSDSRIFLQSAQITPSLVTTNSSSTSYVISTVSNTSRTTTVHAWV